MTEPEFDLCPLCWGDRLLINELNQLIAVCIDCGAMEEMNATNQKPTSDGEVFTRGTTKA